MVKLAVNSSDFVKELDQQPLKVSETEGSEYVLSIDGNDVGTFSKDQLAEGINLAHALDPDGQAGEQGSIT